MNNTQDPTFKNMQEIYNKERQEDAEKLGKEANELHNLYRASLKELQLETYLHHYRYMFYAYFRYGVDLLALQTNNYRNLKLDWNYISGEVRRDPDTRKLYVVNANPFQQVKLVYGEGTSKELICVLPGIACTPTADQYDEDLLSNSFGDEIANNKEREKVYGAAAMNELINKYGKGFSTIVDGLYKNDITRKHAVRWVKLIETVDEWIKNKYPALYKRLIKLPTIEDVKKNIEAINSSKEVVDETKKEQPKEQKVGKFTKKPFS